MAFKLKITQSSWTQPVLWVVALVALHSLAGCANLIPGFLQPYKFNLQQGNFVSREMVAQLRPGMTREQVKFTLGTPMVASVFHTNQWNYMFYNRRPNGEIIERYFTVYFESDKLARWVGDEMPSELPQAKVVPPKG
jgi:outer membrane protein assembly factor BamE